MRYLRARAVPRKTSPFPPVDRSFALIRERCRGRFAVLELVFTGTAGSSVRLFLTIPTARGHLPHSASMLLFRRIFPVSRVPSSVTFLRLRAEQKSERRSFLRPDRKKRESASSAVLLTGPYFFFLPFHLVALFLPPLTIARAWSERSISRWRSRSTPPRFTSCNFVKNPSTFADKSEDTFYSVSILNELFVFDRNYLTSR